MLNLEEKNNVRNQELQIKYPAKYLPVENDVFVIFDGSYERLKKVSVKTEYLDGLLTLIVSEQFYIPVNYLNITNKSASIRLYLAGADSTVERKLNIFSIVEIDDKLIGKLIAIKDMV
jgi:hypothetical protein